MNVFDCKGNQLGWLEHSMCKPAELSAQNMRMNVFDCKGNQLGWLEHSMCKFIILAGKLPQLS
jgi:hypothetical protein